MVRIMKKIENLKELQKINILILKELYRVAIKNDIKIYLFGGTLIGALRDNKFIPWDDDIDLCLSRNDYEKLVKISKIEFNKEIELLDPYTNDEFRGYIPQVVYKKSKLISKQYREKEENKIGISLFIFDGITENKVLRWFYYKRMRLLRIKHALCRANFSYVNTSIAKKIGPVLQPFFKSEDVYKYKHKILELQKKYNYKDCNLVSANSDTNGYKEISTRKAFEIEKKILFEGIECLIYSSYKEYLEKCHPTYKKLPPLEKRKPKHGFLAWYE